MDTSEGQLDLFGPNAVPKVEPGTPQKAPTPDIPKPPAKGKTIASGFELAAEILGITESDPTKRENSVKFHADLLGHSDGCARCGGGGHYSRNSAGNTLCYDCGGKGRLAIKKVTPELLEKLRTDVETGRHAQLLTSHRAERALTRQVQGSEDRVFEALKNTAASQFHSTNWRLRGSENPAWPYVQRISAAHDAIKDAIGALEGMRWGLANPKNGVYTVKYKWRMGQKLDKEFERFDRPEPIRELIKKQLQVVADLEAKSLEEIHQADKEFKEVMKDYQPSTTLEIPQKHILEFLTLHERCAQRYWSTINSDHGKQMVQNNQENLAILATKGIPEAIVKSLPSYEREYEYYKGSGYGRWATGGFDDLIADYVAATSDMPGAYWRSAEQSKDHSGQANPEPQDPSGLQASRVRIHDGPWFDCYLKQERWNGWAQPLVTKETGQAIVAWISDKLGDEVIGFDPARDGFSVRGRDSEVGFISPADAVVQGKPVKLYDFSNGWTWENQVPEVTQTQQHRPDSGIEF